MRFWQAAKSPFLILVSTMSALFIVWVLVSAGIIKYINPGPEQAAEQLVQALAARRYEGAVNQLSGDLKHQVKKDELISLMESLEKTERKGISSVKEKGAQENGEQAVADVEVMFENRESQTVQIPLILEHGVWKVSSVDPLFHLFQ